MSDDKENTVEEELDNSREIPAVGRKPKDGQGSKAIVFGILGVVVITIVYFIITSSEKEESEPLTVKEEIDFAPASSAKIEIPKLPPKPTKTFEQTATPRPVVAKVTPKMSAEDKQRLKREADLRERRKRAPIVVFDQIRAGATALPNASSSSREAILANLERHVSNTGTDSGLARNSGGQSSLGGRLNGTATASAQASLIEPESQPFLLAQGTIIGCVLETAIQSDLPGMTRCILSEDVYSFDGSIRLVEKGSRIIGEYQSGARQGQTRIFVLWTRIITPHGVDIELNSPGTGPLGRSGLSGWVDTKFLERFGSSLMFSLVGAAGARVAAEGSDDDQQIRDDVSENFNRSAEIALENSINVSPTINVNQGSHIKVFVARDIDFQDAYWLNQAQQGYTGK